VDFLKINSEKNISGLKQGRIFGSLVGSINGFSEAVFKPTAECLKNFPISNDFFFTTRIDDQSIETALREQFTQLDVRMKPRASRIARSYPHVIFDKYCVFNVTNFILNINLLTMG